MSNTPCKKKFHFKSTEDAGVELIKIISDLWYDKSIEMVLFKINCLTKRVSDIINLHQYAGEFVGKPITIFDSVEIARAIWELDLPPAKLDIGKLTYEYLLDDENIQMQDILF
jgi:glyceraldehyde 3-phosphate dehydrogenase